jgi:dephospho-CoA kinase
MSKLLIIGVAGTNGAGKDTVGHILADHHGFLFVSVTDLLRKEAERRSLPVERGVLRTISAEWRRALGLGVLVDKAVAEYETVKDKYKGVVIASLRNPGEADRVHALGGTVVWIDADPRVRYDRIQKARETRGRAGEDDKTFEQFQKEQAEEMTQAGDSATVNMSGVKDIADISIDNDDSGVEKFRRDLEKALGLSGAEDADRTGDQ